MIDETKNGGTVNEDTKLMTDEELCDLLRITTRTLRRQLKKPDCPLHRVKQVKACGQRRWVREAVMAFVFKDQF